MAYWRAVEAEVLERVARPLRNAIRRRNPQAPSSGIVLELRDMGNLMHALRKARAGEALYAIVQQVVSIEWPAHATFLLTQLPDCIERGSRIRNPAAHGREVQWSQVSILREIVFGDGGEESIFADLPSARTPRIGGA